MGSTRRSTAHRWTAAAGLVVVLAGCGASASDTGSASGSSTSATSSAVSTSTGNGATSGDSPSSSPAKASSSTPTSDGKEIVGSAFWNEVPWQDPWDPSGSTYRMTNGAYVVPGSSARYSISEGNYLEYADVDGDGHQDALVTVTYEDDQAYREETHVWLWDPAKGSARQVLPPVGVDSRCGRSGSTFSVDEQGLITVRFKEAGPLCAEPATDVSEIVVKVEDGFAWQVEPTVSALHCPAVPGPATDFAGSALGDDELRAWASAQAPVVGTAKDIRGLGGNEPIEIDGWSTVSFDREGWDTGQPLACGFLVPQS